MGATFTWLGHATVELKLADGRVVFIDPWMTGNPSCPADRREPHRCDLIVLTHGHADHIGDVDRLVASFNAPVITNYDLCAALRTQTPNAEYIGMNTGGTVAWQDLKISLTRAYHSSAIETPDGLLYGGMPNGVILQAPGLATLYHAGDTDVFSDMKLIAELYKPAIALLPIGDRFTMGAEGAALAARFVGAGCIVPIHYGTFEILAPDAEAFRAALPEQLKSSLCVASPGRPLNWTATGLA